jgi:UDP-2,3-diacylglucosamine hydrolase
MSKIYFASDMHLGFPTREKSIVREKRVVKWLDQIIDDADELYLVGDIFDFWFEYKHVVPRGYTRFLGKIAEFTDRGIPVHFFTGNHDVWVFDYLKSELGVQVYRKPVTRTIDDKVFHIGHGDGLGSGDWSFKLLKRIFTSSVLQWMFARIHPNSAVGFAHRWSLHSRYSKGIKAEVFIPEKEHLVHYVQAHQKHEPCDYYIFGHRHMPLIHRVGDAIYANLGDWITHFTFGEWSNNRLKIKHFSEKNEMVIVDEA